MSDIYIISDEDKGKRLDLFLNLKYPDYSRSHIQKMIENGEVILNNIVHSKGLKAGYKLKSNDSLEINISPLIETEILPQDIHLDILYEDDDIIVINKPKDMVVHPAPGHYEGTLVNALLYHCKDSLSGINGQIRPGIVHRIDKDTTGALVVCKNDYSHINLAEQLKVHSITRVYDTIVYGKVKDLVGTIETTIGRSKNDRKKMAVGVKDGRRAVTHYHVTDNLNNRYTRLDCTLETGRTHQIRVSLASIGHPVLGDTIYGPSKQSLNFNLQGQALHAKILGFNHPRT